MCGNNVHIRSVNIKMLVRSFVYMLCINVAIADAYLKCNL